MVDVAALQFVGRSTLVLSLSSNNFWLNFIFLLFSIFCLQQFPCIHPPLDILPTVSVEVWRTLLLGIPYFYTLNATKVARYIYCYKWFFYTSRTNPTNSVVILQSLVLRSVVLGRILIYWNWSIMSILKLSLLFCYFLAESGPGRKNVGRTRGNPQQSGAILLGSFWQRDFLGFTKQRRACRRSLLCPPGGSSILLLPISFKRLPHGLLNLVFVLGGRTKLAKIFHGLGLGTTSRAEGRYFFHVCESFAQNGLITSPHAKALIMADQKGYEVPETGRKRARRKESGSQTEDNEVNETSKPAVFVPIWPTLYADLEEKPRVRQKQQQLYWTSYLTKVYQNSGCSSWHSSEDDLLSSRNMWTTWQENASFEMERVIKLESDSRRNNLIFYSFPEEVTETSAKSESLLYSSLENELKLEEDDIDGNSI